MEIAHVVDCLFESCGNGIGISACAAIEHVENSSCFVKTAKVITVHHRKLIKVGKQR